MDIADYEGGPPEDTNPGDSYFDSAPPTAAAVGGLGEITNSLRIKIPMATQQTASRTTTKESRSTGKENDITTGNRPGSAQTTIKGFTLHLNANPPTETPFEANKTAENQKELSDEEDEGTESRHTFCHADYREAIVNMMERHYCAHPVIPGYAAPDPRAIKRWAVQQMYGFCTKHGLPEVWAYLWENWYRKVRWELWARSVHDMIPILKTTMILESQ